jgi:hypothetical protein
MCRNIRRLYNVDPPATEEEVRDAAVQFVRKVSGYRSPSQANEAAFEQAVNEIARSVETLLVSLTTNAAPQDRALAAAKAQSRAARRYSDTRS